MPSKEKEASLGIVDTLGKDSHSRHADCIRLRRSNKRHVERRLGAALLQGQSSGANAVAASPWFVAWACSNA